ncbi:gephyrin-like molybdotransferase Glp [Thermohalobacter berrensis]|uniref:Molybdopterin molybdenumtransferase n=1 Tax=Thermohalobacter berrensis TaxID=99594 RepID=A0A419T2F0_9FIRM|nr:gephyrin-like molybdotransferase Glp [Thermohalobacter berrensis]RKD31645.1 molybdopterin molybdenumtransferase MoeA [Thermohalobacter berrensis]
MDFFKVVSIEEAREKLINNFKDYKLPIEEVDILDSLNRVLAEDIISNINVPEFNRSTVDGYAIKSSDSHGANESMPSFLNIVGEVKMGENTNIKIKSGEAVYVPTGGMIPEGADSVIMIENAERLDENTIAVYKAISPGENLIFKGDDIKKGELVLEKGKRVTSQDIGALAAIGISKVKVYRRPKFYVISTGDEIIDIDEELEIGKIRDINGYSLSALIKKIGGEVVDKVIVKDDFDLLKEEMEKALSLSDIVLISGGSSVGARDYTYDLINSFDDIGVFVHGVSIKPGKPTLIGRANGKAVFGLPGHPVSAIIVFKVFVEHFIKELIDYKEEIRKTKAIMDFNVHSSPGKETYQMVTLEERDGKLYATPIFGKSGMITLLSKSNGYIVIKSHEEGVTKGEEREVFFL